MNKAQGQQLPSAAAAAEESSLVGVEPRVARKLEKDENTDAGTATKSYQETRAQEEDEHTSTLETSKMLSGLSIGSPPAREPSTGKNILICDAGYGFPSETRPGREKILAVAKQLHNFLEWQAAGQEKNEDNFAGVKIVVASEKDQVALQARLQELWGKKKLPDHVEFCPDFPDEEECVYLSPDAPQALSPTETPPTAVVVGMLIDRRVQPNRSLNRANKLDTRCARWPLEVCQQKDMIHPHEPLNVDVVLEGMQQWWWNVEERQQKISSECGDVEDDWPFIQAVRQALQRHYKRHPNRPLHKKTNTIIKAGSNGQ